MIDHVIKYKEFYAIIVSALSIIVPLSIYILTKNIEQKTINFDRFNNLISKLSNQSGDVGLDEQVALLYELKDYPEYYPVIVRILTYQVGRWKTLLKNNPQFSLLINEASITITYINTNWVKRVWLNK